MSTPDSQPGQPPISPLRRPGAHELPPPVPPRRPRYTPRQERRKYHKALAMAFGIPTVLCAVSGSPMAFVCLYCWAFLACAPWALKRLWRRFEAWVDDRPAERLDDESPRGSASDRRAA